MVIYHIKFSADFKSLIVTVSMLISLMCQYFGLIKLISSKHWTWKSPKFLRFPYKIRKFVHSCSLVDFQWTNEHGYSNEHEHEHGYVSVPYVAVFNIKKSKWLLKFKKWVNHIQIE